jgi:tRNA-Thr(GGU) m(6)t(6)A37 methyltransferase TsaA
MHWNAVVFTAALSIFAVSVFFTRKKKLDRNEKEENKECNDMEMKPIGFVESAFRDRRGVPRQGNLIQSSRARLKFLPFIHPKLSLEGLEQYSHVWVIVYLHENTAMHKKNPKIRIQPPRLKGEKVGVYGTRSPHRHNSIGLSLAKIESVDLKNGEILVSQLDFVDRTPILDVKPYIPRYDSSESKAIVPDWITENESLKYSKVEISPEMLEKISMIPFAKMRFYKSADEVVQVIMQTLIHDLRPASKLKYVDPSEVFEIHLDALRIQYMVDFNLGIVHLKDIKVQELK